MKKLFISCSFLIFTSAILSGCGMIGSKTASMSIVYGATAILSLLILLFYCLAINKKDVWFLLLFSSVFVVNIGYFTLSISKSLEEGLLANRISYLGSVFLPMAMLMIILNTIHFHYKKWLPGLLFIIGFFVFLVAASPGYLDIYYKEVVLETVNGVSVLNKVYGPWHCIYLFYLMTYFAAMIIAIIHATVRKVIDSLSHAVILLTAVFVNIGVWLIEQMVKIDFEVLAVSYIISELFLLGLHIIMSENQKLKENLMVQAESLASDAVSDSLFDNSAPHTQETTVFPANIDSVPNSPNKTEDLHEQFRENLAKLTRTEHIIFDFYVSGKTTKEIMNELCITENTLKFHNKNIYSKMEVSSRRQLIEIYRQIESKKASVQ